MTEHDNDVAPDHAGDFAIDEPLPAGATEPVDVVQVRADEALIAALGGQHDVQVDDPIDERLAGLLQGWRDDVHAEPQRPLVDVGAAQAALASAPRPRRRHNPIGPWATAAAVMVVAFVGMGLAARGAEPGDPLWNVTKVLYSEKARSVEAASAVRIKLDEASKALYSGRIFEAKVALEEAQSKLPVINVEDGQQQLATRTEQLLSELDGTSALLPTPTAPTDTVATSTTPSASTTVEPTSPPDVTAPTTPPDTETSTTQPTIGTSESSASTNPAPGSGDEEQTPQDSSQSPQETGSSSSETATG